MNVNLYSSSQVSSPISTVQNFKFGEASVTGFFETEMNKDQFDVFPNPVSKNVLNLSFGLKESSLINYELFDLNGTLLLSVTSKGVTGSNSYTLDLDTVKEGSYLLKLTSNTFSSSQLIVKQ